MLLLIFFSLLVHPVAVWIDRVVTHSPIRHRSPDVIVWICALGRIVSKVQVRARMGKVSDSLSVLRKNHFLSRQPDVVMTVGSLTKSFCGDLRESCKPINFYLSGWLAQFWRASDEFWLIRLEPRVGVNKHSADNYAPSTHNSSQSDVKSLSSRIRRSRMRWSKQVSA